jgi:hypothetical protein
MQTEKLVNEVLFGKTELASQKIDLSLLSDFEKNFNLSLDNLNKTEPEYRNIVNNARTLYANIEKINTQIVDTILEFNRLEKISNDLGVKLESDTLGKRGRLQNMLRTVETVKADLKKIV